MSKVYVYSKSDCVQCEYTKKFLDKNNIPYIEIDVTQNASYRKFLHFYGVSQLPYVISKYGKWNGFRIEKLKGLIAAESLGHQSQPAADA